MEAFHVTAGFPGRSLLVRLYRFSAATQASSQIHFPTVDDSAWEIRKMLRFIKRKGNRQEVSMEA